MGRPDFRVDPHLLRRGLVENGYTELPVTSTHAVTVTLLPSLHKDPFDRMLIAQAQVEGITLLTADDQVGRYPGADPADHIPPSARTVNAPRLNPKRNRRFRRLHRMAVISTTPSTINTAATTFRTVITSTSRRNTADSTRL